jgi:tetratricopeptide (TPR) repeat protein
MLGRMKRTLLVCLTIVLLGFSSAQLNPEARAALASGREAAARALSTYSAHHSDQDLWREAIHHGNRALTLAPEAPEVHRFLAETYTTTRWHARAWESWLRYAELAPHLDSRARRQIAEVGRVLASSRLQGGDAVGAREVYLRLVEINPGDVLSLSWLARHYLERGELEPALAYWQEVLRLHPDDETALEHVEMITAGLRHGLEAARLFLEGRQAAGEGNLEAALDIFLRATEASPRYAEAWAGAAKASQDLGRLDEAERLWWQVLRLEPGDETARHALELLGEQRRWGVEAVSYLRTGLEVFEDGWLLEANEYFRWAAAANPRYKEAFVLTARSFEALGDGDQAYLFWRRVLTLDPNDEEARAALAGLERQSGYGRTFYDGLEHYLAGDLEAAARRLGAATVLDPQRHVAWYYLARVRLLQGEHRAAARYLEQALALDPANVTYRYYLDEARKGGESH